MHSQTIKTYKPQSQSQIEESTQVKNYQNNQTVNTNHQAINTNKHKPHTAK